jgi:TetR/AcrR family transcriptional repressor of nem operon
MPRASRQDAERHRDQIVDAAARLFREHGIDGVSVPDLMATAGLTHGGFYRHFDSKEALVALATARMVDEHTERAADEAELVQRYLTGDHREDPGHGCPVAALAGEVARTPLDSPVRAELIRGVHAFADELMRLGGHERDEALARLSTLVGALVLARATEGDPLSDEILAAARGALAG